MDASSQCRRHGQIVWNVSFFVPSVVRFGVRGDVALQQDPNSAVEQATVGNCSPPPLRGKSPTPNPEVTMTFHLGWQLSFRRSTSRLLFQYDSALLKRPFASRSTPSSRKFRRTPWIASAFLLSGVGLVSYDPPQQVTHTLHAVRRCSRVAEAVVPSAIDYKRTLWRDYDSETSRHAALSECHVRSANRVLRAMLANGGEFYALWFTFFFFFFLLSDVWKGYTSKWGKRWLLCELIPPPTTRIQSLLWQGHATKGMD